MDQFLINSRSIMTNLNQFQSVFDILRKKSVGIVNLTFLHQSNTHSRWFRINENQFDYSDQSVTLFDLFSIN